MPALPEIEFASPPAIRSRRARGPSGAERAAGGITRDESRHFGFYFQQAQRRLARPGAARIARLLVDRFWAPVGSGVQPPEETRALAAYLFSGDDGLQAARRIDDTIRRRPDRGLDDPRWMPRTRTAPGGTCAVRALSREFAPVQPASR